MQPQLRIDNALSCSEKSHLASKVKGVEMSQVVDRRQQPIYGCIGSSEEKSISKRLLSSDFWPLQMPLYSDLQLTNTYVSWL